MRRLITTAGLAMLAVGLTVSAAQQPATVHLRSGATLNGELVDLGGAGFTVRVNGQDRVIARHEVVLIDFGGGPAPTPPAAHELAPGSNLALLNSGEVVIGEFYDVGGTVPLRITFRTSGGDRNFQGNQVRRIYMDRAPVAEIVPPIAPGPTPPTGTTTTVVVPARTAWTTTGISVSRGQQLHFDASGDIVFSPRGHVATPAGSVDGLLDSNAPLPRAPQGALIGRVGADTSSRRGRGSSNSSGSVFVVGDRTPIVMPADGMLFLGINDSGLNDNRGQFTVRITR